MVINLFYIVEKITRLERMPINAAKKLSLELVDHDDEQIRMRAKIAYEACNIASGSLDANDVDVARWSLERLGHTQKEADEGGLGAQRVVLAISRALCEADLFTPADIGIVLDSLNKFIEIDPTLSSSAAEAGRVAVISGSYGDVVLALHHFNAVVDDFALKLQHL